MKIPILGPFLANFKQSSNPNELEFQYAVNRILHILSLYIHKQINQTNLAEWKPRIEMGKMAGNAPVIQTQATFYRCTDCWVQKCDFIRGDEEWTPWGSQF